MLIMPAGHAQERDAIEAIIAFLGVDSPQELDADEVERLSELHDVPIRLNWASGFSLMATGLFSQYQIAVISDYRDRHGEILSLAELSSLDGFGEDFVTILAPFISLEPKISFGENTQPHLHQDLHVRAGYKAKDNGHHASYALKYRLQTARGNHFSLALSKPYGTGQWYPSTYSSAFLWRFKGDRGGVTAGDFNARFGQGLALWNNMFMTGLVSPESFMKKPAGISPVWSYTGTSALTGVAADVRFGRWVLSAMTAFPGLKNIGTSPDKLKVMPAVNLVRYGSHGHVALTNVATLPVNALWQDMDVRTSLDCAFCFRGINLFGELAYLWNVSGIMAVAGSRFNTGEKHDMAVLMRYSHEELFLLAASGAWNARERRHTGTWSVESSYYPISKDEDEQYSLQVKSLFVWDVKLSACLHMKLRLSERIRTWGEPFRTDFRADLSCNVGAFSTAVRLNAVSCSRFGMLAYVEGEYDTDVISVHLRQGVFCVDDWEDRIYVYEHDAPGSFNAPAMYGRGLWTSIALGTHLTSDIRLYLRAAYTGYPFMSDQNKKPGKAELKIQMQYRF